MYSLAYSSCTLPSHPGLIPKLQGAPMLTSTSVCMAASPPALLPAQLLAAAVPELPKVRVHGVLVQLHI